VEAIQAGELRQLLLQQVRRRERGQAAERVAVEAAFLAGEAALAVGLQSTAPSYEAVLQQFDTSRLDRLRTAPLDPRAVLSRKQL
jgi:hypothetical protein